MSAEPLDAEPLDAEPLDAEPRSAEPTGDVGGFTAVCHVDDLAPGTASQAEVDGVIVALVRDADGGYHAVDDRCSHADVSLSEGEVDGCTLECWLHGSRFDLLTGNPSGLPAITPIAVYPVKIDGDQVLVAVTPTTELETLKDKDTTT